MKGGECIMSKTLSPNSLWQNQFIQWPSFFEDGEWTLPPFFQDGLSISEDDSHMYVEAAIPGVDPKDVNVTFDKGLLWIRGEAKEEEKNRKFYRKASRSFSYRTSIPSEIENNAEPNAQYKNGVIHVTFKKVPASEPKQIKIKI